MSRIIRPTLLAALALGASTVSLFAQDPAGPPPPSHHHGPPPSPLFDVLDANHDGIISVDEIANAPATLKTLTDASGQITHAALGPVRRHEGESDPARPVNRDFQPCGERRERDEQPPHRPPPPADMDQRADADDHAAPPPPPPRRRAADQEARDHRPPPQDQDADPRPPRPGAEREHRPRQGPPPAANNDQPPDADGFHGQSVVVSPAPAPAAADRPPIPPDAGGSPSDAGMQPDQGQHRPPPPMPLFDALDANHDGVISTEEMDHAAAALKKLDTKGGVQLRREDFRPPHPPRPDGN